MNTWNDCPVCNELLEFSNDLYFFYCSSGESHYEIYFRYLKGSKGLIDSDCILMKDYSVVRRRPGTKIVWGKDCVNLDGVYLSIDECLDRGKINFYRTFS